MRVFIRKHFSKIIYIFLLAIVFVRIICFQADVSHDRKTAEKAINTTLTYRIVSVPSDKGNKTVFFAEFTHGADLKTGMYVSMLNAPSDILCTGDIITSECRLYVPASAGTEGEYDMGRYIASQGASLMCETDASSVSAYRKSIFSSFYSIRSKLTKRIFRYLRRNEAALINALVTGSKDEMYQSQKENFRRAGVYHIVAVSGMHLGMLLMFVSAIYINLKIKRKSRKYLALVITLASCSFLVAFTGFGISVQRASLMAFIMCVSSVISREYSPFNALLTVLCAVLTVFPERIGDVSLQLSFSATAGVFFGTIVLRKYKYRFRKFRFLAETLVITLLTFITTLPFTVYNFGYISIIGIISNAIILLFVPFLMVSSYTFAIMCIVLPEFICREFAPVITAPAYVVNILTDFFAGIPFGYVPVTAGLIVIITVEILLTAIFVKFTSKRIRIGVLAVFLIANSFFMAYNVTEDVTISFVNAGQGDCTLISSENGNDFMIDCGSESEYNIGERRIVPMLNSLSVGSIELLFVTHFHNDHTNGIAHLIENGYVKKLVFPGRITDKSEEKNSQKLYALATEYNIPIIHAYAGDELTYGKNHRFEIMYPDKYSQLDANDNSMIIKYSCEDVDILFTGDTGYEVNCLVADKLTPCEILKVPHHGSKYIAGELLYQKVLPQYSIISCGRNNKYNHPAPETLRAFEKSTILRTDTAGKSITFRIKNRKLRRD